MLADTDYASREHVIELEYARGIFKERPEWPVIDVSRRPLRRPLRSSRMIAERKRSLS